MFHLRENVIELSDVSKKYENGCIAVKNFSIALQKGEFLFLIGPSGSGKTTVLKLLIKEEEATEGKITVNGRDLAQIDKKQLPFYRRELGVVFQDNKILYDRTVYENIAFGMRAVGCSSREIRKRVPEVIFLVGLTNKARVMPSQLSGGEQQRVAIARALVNSPGILLADEPTGNLDPDNSIAVMELFNDINKIGTTVIIATHEKVFVDKMEKRVVALKNGEVIRDEAKGHYGDKTENFPENEI